MKRIHQAYARIQPEVEERRPKQGVEKRAVFEKNTMEFLRRRDRLKRAEQRSRWTIRVFMLSFPAIIFLGGTITGAELLPILLLVVFISAILALLYKPILALLYKLRNSTRHRLMTSHARDELLCEIMLALVEIMELDQGDGHGDVLRDGVMKRLGTMLEMAEYGTVFHPDRRTKKECTKKERTKNDLKREKDLKRELNRVGSAFCEMVSVCRKMLIAPDRTTRPAIEDKLAKMAAAVFLELDGELITMADEEPRSSRLIDRLLTRKLRAVLVAFIPLPIFALLKAMFGSTDVVTTAVLPVLLIWTSAIIILEVDPEIHNRMSDILRLFVPLQKLMLSLQRLIVSLWRTARDRVSGPEPEPNLPDQPSDRDIQEPPTPDPAATENRV